MTTRSDFYYEQDEETYRLYRKMNNGEQDHFLGFFDSIQDVNNEIKLQVKVPPSGPAAGDGRRN